MTRSVAARPAGPTAARAAQAMRVGVGLERRLDGADAVADGPWGLWHRPGDDTAAPVTFGSAALARYAETLRRRRGSERTAPARGLPLVVRRRGGTAAGARSGPGGLASALVPVDRPERPDIAAILRDGRRPAAAPMPLPRPRTDRPGVR